MLKTRLVEVLIDVFHEIGQLKGRNMFGSESEMFFTQETAITYYAYTLVNKVFWNTLPVLQAEVCGLLEWHFNQESLR